MARKSKRMALNAAIRQGQAKLAKSSEKRQSESENPDLIAAEGPKELLNPDSLTCKSAVKSSVFLLKSEEETRFLRNFPQKTKWIILVCASLVGVLILGIWLISLIVADQPEQRPGGGISVTGPIEDENAQEKSRPLSEYGNAKPSDSPQSGTSEKESLLTTTSGDNVICIQSIVFDRKDELKPLGVFFQRHGIDTEVIAIDGPSGRLAVLATRVGFEQNPLNEGTEGYELAQRIKQLGPVYVKETNDTKFGAKPFQDVYGHKR
jgi:hypothetical protein